MIALVGRVFGEANVNIADMTISRRDKTAMMVLKLDDAPTTELFDALKAQQGILKVASVQLGKLDH
jgi:hypothetical protein